MSTNWVRLAVLTRSVFMPRRSRNGNDEMRAGVFQAGMPFDLLECRLSPPRGERQKAKLAGLQRLVGIDEVRQKFLMGSDRTGFAVERPADHLLKLFRLIFDLILRSLDRSLKRRVQYRYGIRPLAKALLNLGAIFLQQGGKVFRNTGGAHALSELLRAFPHLL